MLGHAPPEARLKGASRSGSSRCSSAAPGSTGRGGGATVVVGGAVHAGGAAVVGGGVHAGGAAVSGGGVHAGGGGACARLAGTPSPIAAPRAARRAAVRPIVLLRCRARIAS